MSELERRTIDVISDTVGDTVTPTVTALLAAAAVVTHNPSLGVLSVPTGALAGALSKQGTQLVIETLRDRADRVQQFADAIEDETGETAEEFISKFVDNGEKRVFLGHIIDAATDAKTAWKIRLLARSFIRGVVDGDLVDETLFYVDLLRKLEPGHARFLRAMQAVTESGEGTRMQAHEVLAKDQGIRRSAPFLRRHLVDLGIVDVKGGNGDGPFMEMSDLGTACAEWLKTLGEEEAARPNDPT